MTDKLKMWGAAIVAAIAVVLAAIYGKRTRSVLEAQLRAIRAREKVLEDEIARAAKVSEAASADTERKAASAKADSLRDMRERLERKRAEIDSGGTDVDFARARRARPGAA